MKICFLTHTIGSFGGTQRIVTTLANKFSEKHEVSIICWSTKNPKPAFQLNSDVKFSIRGMTFIEKVFRETTGYLASAGFFKSKYTIWLYEYLMFFPTLKNYYSKLINKNNFDIVIAGGAFEGLLLASINKQIKAKTIGRLQASYNHFFGHKKKTAWNQENIFYNLLKRLNKVVCLSNHDKKLYSNLIGSNVTFNYNANSFIPSKFASLNNKKFLSLGRFAHQKGFDILVEAFIIFSRKNKDWTLDIVGDGSLKSDLNDIIVANHLQHRVNLLPGTPNVKEVYPKASVFIFTSRFEGFGIVQVEALSCGLPIIASDIPISKELLDGKKVGAFFENENPQSLAEAMFRFTELDLSEMSKNAVEYAKEFTVNRIALKWDELFNELTS